MPLRDRENVNDFATPASLAPGISLEIAPPRWWRSTASRQRSVHQPDLHRLTRAIEREPRLVEGGLVQLPGGTVRRPIAFARDAEEVPVEASVSVFIMTGRHGVLARVQIPERDLRG